MAHNPAYDLALYFASQNAGYTFGTNVFTGKMPDSPAKAVCFYAGPGFEPFETLSSSPDGFRYPTVMVHVRGSVRDYLSATSLCELVVATLHKALRFTANTQDYEVVEMIGEPNWLEYDESDRPKFSLNFKTTIVV